MTRQTFLHRAAVWLVVIATSGLCVLLAWHPTLSLLGASGVVLGTVATLTLCRRFIIEPDADGSHCAPPI